MRKNRRRALPLSKNRHHFLTMTGPYRIHPVIGSAPCTFLTFRFPKLISMNQEKAYREATR